MLRVLNARFLAVFVMLLFGLACSGLDSQGSAETRQKEVVNLPSEVRDQGEFEEAANESAVILLLTSDNKLYQEQMQFVKDPQFDLSELKSTVTSISWEQLPGILKGVRESTETEKKIVYLKIDSGATQSIVVPLLRAIRDAGITSVGLLTEKKPDWSAGYKGLFNVDLLAPVDKDPDAEIRPNPLTLVAYLGDDGSLKLNNEELGTLPDTEKLEELLIRVFKDRNENGVTREGTNEIERTVNVRASDPSKYGDVVKLVDALKRAGAAPIILEIDDPEPIEIITPDDPGFSDNSNTNQE